MIEIRKWVIIGIGIAGISVLISIINQLIATIFTIACVLLLAIIILTDLRAMFYRFDYKPAIAAESDGKLTIETLRINRMFAKIIKSHHTPGKNAPVVIMHHGYGSDYKRMLVYAYPVALKGYAVLVYNAPGHGKVLKREGKKTDERSPGEKNEIIHIMRSFSHIVDFTKSRDDLGVVGFVGISLGAVVGLTYGTCNPDVKIVIALAGVHNFQRTATRNTRFLSLIL
jgi:pimeloyl-ACP methyl ester carboxylesterase